VSSIFISHSSHDNAWAKRIRDWLQGAEDKQEPERRYEALFLDFDPECGIPNGTSWRAVLHQKLRLSRAVIVVCSRRYCSSQWCLAELGIAIHEGKLVLPLRIEPQVDRSDLPRLLAETQASVLPLIDLEAADSTAWRALERGLEVLSWRERLPWPPPGQAHASPFPGLLAFDRPLAPVFFGRDGAIAQVQQQLNALAQRKPAMLLLLGASGTGKSSLVRAGVLPQLAADGERRWRVLPPFRPGHMPMARVGMVEQELEADSDAPLLVVIDQLEELLLDNKGGRATEAKRFLSWLQSLLQQELLPLVVLATLRTDCLDVLQRRCPALARLAVSSTVEPIQPPGFAELIRGPAERVGLTLQPGLQERLVADSCGADALPLLAFTLEKLWLQRQKRGVAVAGPNGAWFDFTNADYKALEGVAGAVSHQAALCWDPLTSPEADTKELRQAFVKHLVKLNDEGLATKQPARWGELPERSRPLLKRFVEARLLVSGGGDTRDLVEIAHEALLRTWEPLVQWIADDRQALEQRRRVTRLCADLALNHPLQARLAALHGLLALVEADPQAAAPAAEALAAALTEANRDPQEWLLAIRLLGVVGGKASVATLGAFLEKQQLPELVETEQAMPVLEALCQAASEMQNIHRANPPRDDSDERWLLLPSATVSDHGEAVRTQLVRLRLWASPKQEAPGAWLEPLGEGVVLTMVAIPSGSFLMGSPLNDTLPIVHPTEKASCPQHLVSLKGFWISQAPITQGQWLQVMGSNPSYFISNRGNSDRRPVEQVLWHHAMEFCRLLSERTGRTYTLPSESQWEYACRAGTTTRFHFGNTLIRALANFGTFPAIEYKRENQDQTSSVGQFPANPWGLHDMHGNVEEWCLDEEHSSYEGAPTDGSAWIDSQNKEFPFGNRMLRGGSWDKKGMDFSCRSAFRAHSSRAMPEDASSGVGFRVVCLPQGPSLDA
jgi:formylglycine-generating enzyme required for sulfatase activity